jgi:hypothetical protein
MSIQTSHLKHTPAPKAQHTLGPWLRLRFDNEPAILDSRPETVWLQQFLIYKIPVMTDIESQVTRGVSKVDIFNNYLRLAGVRNTNATELFTPRKPDLAKELGYESNLKETFLDYLPLSWYSRMILVCWVFQQLRDHLGEPISIYNSYRPPTYNKAVGGAPASDHIFCSAIDMSFRNSDSRRKAESFLKDFRRKNPSLNISLGFGNTMIHLGVLSPRGSRTWFYDNYVP